MHTLFLLTQLDFLEVPTTDLDFAIQASIVINPDSDYRKRAYYFLAANPARSFNYDS